MPKVRERYKCTNKIKYYRERIKAIYRMRREREEARERNVARIKEEKKKKKRDEKG